MAGHVPKESRCCAPQRNSELLEKIVSKRYMQGTGEWWHLVVARPRYVFDNERPDFQTEDERKRFPFFTGATPCALARARDRRKKSRKC
jgi:hypothetical protein